MKQIEVWNLAKQSLENNVPVMLLYVVESNGSSPGRQGFAMAVTATGQMQGSVGGGIMEHKFVEMAKEKLHKNEPISQLRKQFHDKTSPTNQSGMICSGDQTIFLYTLQKADLTSLDSIIKTLKNAETGVLTLTPNGFFFNTGSTPKRFLFEQKSEQDWIYQEQVGLNNKLFIIGGGHCSLALSQLFTNLDFYIELFEDRQNLNTYNQNQAAHRKTLLNDYSELESLIPSGEDCYVVVMTFGYRTDDIAIKALIHKKFKYFGILGSRSKMEKLFRQYLDEGISSVLLSRLHTPAGIPIKSQTPEEIAISIAAEIIKIKNGA